MKKKSNPEPTSKKPAAPPSPPPVKNLEEKVKDLEMLLELIISNG